MSTESQTNNKRIAKNTILLYIRMLFTMVISFYTSRVILQNLGVEDFGIYNVVGGIVAMFSFFNSAMASATQRFLNYDMATGDNNLLSRTFNTSLIIHFLIALIIIIFSETVGLWFFYEKMVIPESRLDAAFWVFQCSVLSMVVNIISVPYNAAIIAHEKMSAFAYISILEVSLKLLIVYLLLISPIDKLVAYAILILIVGIAIRIVYGIYCNKHFPETKFHLVWDKCKIKEMGAFASWNLIGNLALMGVTQGLNIVLNMFFGPIVNAARAVAVQVQGAINQVSQNFQVAVNPQIVKSYSKGDFEYMHRLICSSSKFSYLLLYIISFPVFVLSDEILKIWLDTPPENSSEFLRLILIIALVDAISNPLTQSVYATGHIKRFQLTNGILMLSCLPIAYAAMKIAHLPAIYVFHIQLWVTIIAHFMKLYMSHKSTGLSISMYIRKVYVRVFLVTTLTAIIFCPIRNNLKPTELINVILLTLISIMLSIVSIYFFGLDQVERKTLKSKFKKFTKK